MDRIRGSMRTGLSGALAVGLAWGGLSSVTPARASDEIPQICSSELNVAESFGVDTSRLNGGVLILDGRSVTLTDDSSTWQVYDPIDNTFNNRFHGMQWLVPWAAAGGDAVSLLVARDAALPDPGAWADRTVLRATGWTTGANRIRQNTVNCLYAMTGDERLLAIIEGIVAVNVDPARYRGKPERPVHNHGMLANHSLIESARVFDRPEWADIAFARMNADARSVFAPCGMSIEQSSSYHLTNLRIWERGLRRAGSSEIGTTAAVADTIDRARVAAVQLARPDGVLEAIGNANQRDIDDIVTELPPDVRESLDTRLWCEDRGWAANRTSWDDTAIHYTLRFGPRRKMHGHVDHGSLTWFAQGVPVLSDPGLFDKTRNGRYRNAVSMAAHSVLEPVGRPFSGGTRATIEESPEGIDRYTLVTQRRSMTRTRSVEISLDHSYLRVRDHASSRWPMQWLQRWQLDPQWQPVSGTTPWTPIATHPDGLYLYAVCHSGISMRMTVGTQEHYPAWRTSVPAMSMKCGGMDRTVTFDTLLVVSTVEGTLRWDRASGAYAVRGSD